jgi:hypothetical protein
MEKKELKLTPEMEKSLKALRGYAPESIHFWTPKLIKENLPKDEWPIFKYKSRRADSYAEAEDELHYSMENGVIKTNSARLRLDILQKCTIDWKNYKDSDKNLIECKKNKDGVVESESINSLSRELQSEYIDAINERSHLSTEEVQGLEF